MARIKPRRAVRHSPEATLAFMAKLVRGARVVEGLTMRELAQRLGVSAATICRVESGQLPDAVTFLRLVDWLQTESAPPRPAPDEEGT